MYKKELKERFREMVIRQAILAIETDDIKTTMWICLYYFDGLNDAVYATRQYDSSMKGISCDNFSYIFKSIVEYRKR
jgi:hypothetical protein